MKQILPVLFLLIFCFFPKSIFAQIFINEVSPISSPEWVELYNDSEDNVDISGWKLIDLANNSKTIPSVVINARGFFVYENSSGWLNNSGQESLVLKNSANETIDTLSYGTDGIVGIPSSDKSIGRSSDGSSSWVNNLDWTKGSTNYLITTIPSPTETPTATETPTSSPTPSKSIYKINKPKDENGQELSSVEIYVDSIYTHHKDNEILEFCNGCFCDSGKAISCGYGQHTIKLTKSGYSDWSEIRNFTEGSNHEITPILTKISTPTSTTSTQTPTSSPSPTPSKTLTTVIARSTPTKQSPTPTTVRDSIVLGSSTDSGTVIATQSALSGSDSAAIINNELTPFPEIEIKKKKPINYKNPFFIGLFLAASSGGLLYFRHRKD